MGVEIERKFLVKKELFDKNGLTKNLIIQGFLSSKKERTVRVRITNNRGFLTIKGPSNSEGMRRYEWEQELRLEEAQELMCLTEPGKIEKYRYTIKQGKHLFEVDEFLHENAGLLLAEIELSDENEVFEKPDWLGEEVTGFSKYYNAALSKLPFKHWQK